MGNNHPPLKIFDKLGVLTCNLVRYMLPFKVKFVLQNYVFLGPKKKIGIREGGHSPMATCVRQWHELVFSITMKNDRELANIIFYEP